MYLDAIVTAIEARADLRVLLEVAEKTKENLFNIDLEESIFSRTYEMMQNIVRDTRIAIENINIEFNRIYKQDVEI